MENFHTSADLFIVIVLAYLGLSLFLGAKQVYFGRFTKPEDQTDEASSKKAPIE
jgi:hypothetical protein